MKSNASRPCTEETSKRCPACETVKDRNEFHSNRRTRSGMHTYCKSCTLEKQRERYASDPEAHIARTKRFWERDLDASRERMRDGHRRRKYGLSPQEFEAMLEAQKGCCAICGGTNPDGRSLAVDHCHRTEKVRALLCFTCNRFLGIFEEVQADERFLSYLKRYQ